METFTDECRRLMIERIKTLTQLECALFQKFAPSGHPYFRSDLPDIHRAFLERFKEVGGMTPEISKEVDGLR